MINLFERYRLMSMAVDVTSECVFSCTGCHVKRRIDVSRLDEDLDKLYTLALDMKSKGYYLYDLVLGPQDVMLADNIDYLLTDDKLARLASLFDCINFTSTFSNESNIKLEEVGAYLEKLAVHGRVKLVMPIETRKVNNPRYLDRIRTNIRKVESGLINAEIKKVCIAINYVHGQRYEKDGEDLRASTMLKLRDSNLHPKAVMDLVIPHLRNGTHNLMDNQNFISSIRHMSEVLDDIAVEEVDRFPPSMTIHELNLDEGRILALTYSEGKLYKNIFLQESVLIGEEQFEIPQPWTVQQVEDTLLDFALRQVTPNHFTEGCMGCNHLPLCIRRDILTVKTAISETSCISPLGYTVQKPHYEV